MSYEQRKQKAIRDVQQMDKAERFANRDIGTIWAALAAGLQRPESNCAYEALVMLEDIFNYQRGKQLVTNAEEIYHIGSVWGKPSIVPWKQDLIPRKQEA